MIALAKLRPMGSAPMEVCLAIEERRCSMCVWEVAEFTKKEALERSQPHAT